MDAFGTPRAFRAGDKLIREDDKGDEMYIIRTGKVRVFKGTGPDAVTLAVIGPGDYLGEMSIVGDHRRSASAVAETNVDVTVVDRATFRAFVSEPIVLDIIRRMSDRIRELDQSVVETQHADQLRRAHLGSIIEQRHWFT